MNRTKGLQLFPLVLVCLLALSQSQTAHAAVTWSGDLDPANPTNWTSSTSGYVGKYSTGSLTVDGVGGAGTIESYIGRIGFGAGVTGTVIVDGVGSVWTNREWFHIGYNGIGVLSISGGGEVSNGNDCDIGRYPGSTGTVTVSGAGSTWNNGGHLNVGLRGSGTLSIAGGGIVMVAEDTIVSASQGASGVIHFDNGTLTTGGFVCGTNHLSGTGTVNTGGLVSDVDLVFDATHGLEKTLTIGNGSDQNITVHLNVDGSGSMGAGHGGVGTTSISQGVVVESSSGYIGHQSGSTGTVTVDGAGSAWNNSERLRVGDMGCGTLSITGGGTVRNSYGSIGCWSDSTGTVIVNGAGSTWKNSEQLAVGSGGSGSLSITGGGDVTVAKDTFVAASESSSGVIHFDNGTLTTHGLLCAEDDLSGTGTINACGMVSDVNLVFDATHGVEQTFTIGDGSDRNITVHLNVDGSGSMGAGYGGVGTTSISQGVVVESSSGYVGYHSGSAGTVAVDGAGSAWHNSDDLRLGGMGDGTLSITGGGAVSNANSPIATMAGSTGTVSVDGAGSTWTSSGGLLVGSEGSGALRITDGGAVSNSFGRIGHWSGSTGTVIVNGVGSTWTNSKELYVGNQGTGRLSITSGGQVVAEDASINSQSLMAIEVSEGSQLILDSGSRMLTNDGTVRIIAGIHPVVGATYSPIAAGNWSGSGTYEALGGTWNDTTHEFTASPVIQAASGMRLQFNQETIQRLQVNDTATGWTVGTSLLATDGPSVIDFTATAIGGDTLSDLEDHMDPGESVLGGWEFTVTGDYTPDEPAYLSFDVGSGQSRADLQIWHYDGSDWAIYDAWDLTYDGTYACFTAEGLSTYAVTPVKDVWLPGDVNGDNRVDKDDVAILAEYWLTKDDATWSMGDFNNDGAVNDLDASILAAHWNPASESNSVPEPSTLMLLAAGMLALGLRGCRVRAR
ncbi:MAG: PEP-CTERM sorting domain-containing protein [Pirellulales bacterium]|nr:PEP-CTERM sorting domain-containing protein [Pirellulales bacterium]